MNYNIKKSLNNKNIIDGYFEQLILEFTEKISISKKKSTILALTELYAVLIEDKKLISKIGSFLFISEITLTHILIFQKKIEQQVSRNAISKTEGKIRLRHVKLFLKFLAQKKLVFIFYKPITFSKSKSVSKAPNSLPLLKHFEQYLNYKNYSKIKNYIKNVKRFLNFSEYKDELSYNDDVWMGFTKNYEEFLRVQVVKEVLTPASAYQYLRGVRLLYSFLYEEKIIFFKYKIPPTMINQAKRNNEFITPKEVLLVVEKILETSTDVLRDLSIFLIILETGCRPIEVSNLTITDVNLKERLINLKSKKSNQRTLKISPTTTDFIKAFLQIRRNYLPDTDVEGLFLTSIGAAISSDTIYNIFRKYILATFGEMKFTPKSLRHTFITNALNNKNNINDVAKAVGHKHLTSTLYYFYRDLNSIKQIIIGKELNLEGELK